MGELVTRRGRGRGPRRAIGFASTRGKDEHDEENQDEPAANTPCHTAYEGTTPPSHPTRSVCSWTFCAPSAARRSNCSTATRTHGLPRHRVERERSRDGRGIGGLLSRPPTTRWNWSGSKGHLVPDGRPTQPSTRHTEGRADRGLEHESRLDRSHPVVGSDSSDSERVEAPLGGRDEPGPRAATAWTRPARLLDHRGLYEREGTARRPTCRGPDTGGRPSIGTRSLHAPQPSELLAMRTNRTLRLRAGRVLEASDSGA